MNFYKTSNHFILIALIALVIIVLNESPVPTKAKEKSKFEPNDWFYQQRFYPDNSIDPGLIYRTLSEIDIQHNRSSSNLNTSWVQLGPGNIGGRINCIAIHPTQNNIKLTGSACGGIFKTQNNGASWYPVFDDHSILAIAEIVFDESNPSVVYACTGDPNISGTPFIGNGVYKSTDMGETWNYLGLNQCGVISDLVINPNNSNVLYAAAMGNPFVRNNDRGLYKSIDGGNTWNNVLFLADEAGVSDIDIDPSNPNILLAAGWNRIRNNQESLIFGNESKLYRSTDAGQNWSTISNGFPTYGTSRIGIERSKQNPSKIYAVVVDTTLDLQGIYKSINNGVSWNSLDISTLDPYIFNGFGWYFGKLGIDPIDDDQIFVLSVDLWKFNAGGTWEMCGPPWYTYEVHADKHDMQFDNAGNYFLATDGGMYKSTDEGLNWSDEENIPNSQFYRIAASPWLSNEQSGGMQDNGTANGNENTLNNWQRIYGGDGFTCIYSPDDPLVYYAETQNGNIVYSEDGGQSFLDGNIGIDPTDRRNWDMVFILSPHNSLDLYTGTFRVYQSTGGVMPDWMAISPDLTDGNIYGDRFHTISTVEESAVTQGKLYAGTTDGNVWIGNTSGTWVNITAGLPDRYVTNLAASPQYANTVYVSHSGYKDNDNIPHIHKSDNSGTNWRDISGDLPNIPVNNILLHPTDSSILFIATDAGVYITQNGGIHWDRLGSGMPVIPVFDITFHPLDNRLLAGTFARSMMAFPLDSLGIVTNNLDSQKGNSGLDVFPNPSADQINFQLAEIGLVKIYEMNSGKKISEQKFAKGQQQIDISTFSAGIYILQVQEENGSRKTLKFIKQ
jgi:hypothetical protein